MENPPIIDGFLGFLYLKKIWRFSSPMLDHRSGVTQMTFPGGKPDLGSSAALDPA